MPHASRPPRGSQRRAAAGATGAAAVRQRLIVAAIACIEREGIEGATVRRIAAEAGANIAAINYYFGGKEALLEAVFAATLHEAFPKALGELREAIVAHQGAIRAGTRAFLAGYLVHALNYPRLSTAHLRDALLGGDYSGPAVQEIRRFIAGFEATIRPAMPYRSAARRRLAVVHVWATLLQLAMLRELYPVEPAELTGPRMVELLLATLFGDSGDSESPPRTGKLRVPRLTIP